MKRLLLVNTNTERAPYPVPPLGLCLLAAFLEKKYDVRIFDGVFREAKELPACVSDFRPDYIGFSIRNIDDILIDRMIFYVDGINRDFIKPVREMTKAPLILGGSGFSMFPAPLMEITEADYGVAGEGETAMERLLMALDGNGPGFPVPNVIRKGEQIPWGSSASTIVDLGKIPFPEIDRRIDFSPYRAKGVYSIQTKRGCSHGCIYCTYPLIEGREFRVRNPELIADELESLYHRMGTLTVEFVDSTFNDPAGHAEAVCRAIIRKNLPMRFRTMGINPRHTSPGLFRLMKEAGFMQIDVTPDSASPKVLENLKKGFGLDEIRKTALHIRETGMPAMWFFLFGAPGESEQTVGETFSFIDQYVSPDDMVFLSGGLRIYPGTPLHRIALKEGVVDEGDSLLFPPSYYFSKDTPREKLDLLLREALETRPNCVLGVESTPPAEMLNEAVEYRKLHDVNEPMFRTLLRIRKKWISEGRL